MPFSQGSRSSLSYITESTFGTTPAGNFQNIPFSTHSLDLTKERVQGSDIIGDRMPRVDRHGNRQVSGDIVVDLRDGDYDDLLAAGMLSTWDTSPVSNPDELKVGTTPVYFSIEDYAADIDQARLFTGCTVTSMAFSLAPKQMVTCTFGLIGKDMTISATEKTQDSASGAAPFDSYSGNITLGDAGGSPSAITSLAALEFTVDNGYQPNFTIGSDSAVQLSYGRATIEGTATFYFEDASLINRFLNETETEMTVGVDDPTGANDYGFYFPRIKINGAPVPVSGEDSRMIEMPFVALYDSTEGSNLTITRPETA